MTVHPEARLISLSDGRSPEVADTAWVAPGAVLAGQVTLLDGASVWYNAVLRAEHEAIVIGAGSNLQDTVACHVDRGFPLTVGSGVSVGHGAVLHGCTIGDDVLVGMSATVLNGAVVGSGSLLAAGTVVLEGAEIPPGSLVAGVPGKVRRELTEEERAGIRANADAYRHHVSEHRSA
ncbi:gamma carbonic anhydrase family protein [Diaminobutyricibacter tongyongensis]|uniref:Gamma carbonic anhydrase family protein n=1 Tax=Leifsonia tongyongensis TaxID=1268043 RepID=A0A6L9XSI0_9MICO|nr:gamma carbonic anhydrase family protein [Diaminobutyricibacter tongyongensis]NEN04379.1 gamma carbonic anhydrase family protein [Diaminobutyricibacter tongyongensis]